MTRASEDAKLLELVGEVMGLLHLDELRPGLLSALRGVIPADWLSVNEFRPDGVVSVVEPHLDQKWIDIFAELAHENPLVQHYERTADGRALRFSDVVTREQLEATRLYREFYAHFDINHQIAFTLPHESGQLIGISLNRTRPDFSDAERDFLNRARPYLIQAYRNALACAARRVVDPAGLEPALIAIGVTQREAEVVAQVAVGASNRDAASRLGLSERTVQKHLERAFRKLGVSSRSEAAARAWELAGSPTS